MRAINALRVNRCYVPTYISEILYNKISLSKMEEVINPWNNINNIKHACKIV